MLAMAVSKPDLSRGPKGTSTLVSLLNWTTHNCSSNTHMQHTHTLVNSLSTVHQAKGLPRKQLGIVMQEDDLAACAWNCWYPSIGDRGTPCGPAQYQGLNQTDLWSPQQLCEWHHTSKAYDIMFNRGTHKRREPR